MNILLFGRNGQLGSELGRLLAPAHDVLAIDREELDLQNADALRDLLRSRRPDLILNASAYTAVDRAEQEQELAFRINGQAPGIMAEEAVALGAALVHVSTDYVFDGKLGRPYIESDPPAPLNVYGRSKLAGEQAIQQVGGAYLILRTSWVYSLGGAGFVTRLLDWAAKQTKLRVVTDQIGNPTWARALGDVIAELLGMAGDSPVGFIRQNAGLYHLAGRGFASRFEWAQEVLKLASKRDPGLASSIQPALTDEFPSPAQRPLFSALDCSCFEQTFGLRLPEWPIALERAMSKG